MLSHEDNELVTRIGPGTPMGTLMREYWIPAMLSSELANPDSDPVRVMLLGEQLIGFRDSSGKVGLIANLCPHRGASLFFGRNEEGGMRCVYHGWKFDTEGSCLDMPNEPENANFKARIRATTYPCVEAGGIVWTYMGPRETPPPHSRHSNRQSSGKVTTSWRVALRECNWLQALEGDLDTSHVAFLHSRFERPEDAEPESVRYYTLMDTAPRFIALDTDYGAIYGAYRPAGPDRWAWRVSQFLFPFYAHISGMLLRAWVPMDDSHTMHFTVGKVGTVLGSTDLEESTTDWFGRFRPLAHREGDYGLDRMKQRAKASFTGIELIHDQDKAVTESMGALLDRTVEHVGTSDAMIIKIRRRLMEAAQAFELHKVVPPGVEDPEVYRTRAAGQLLRPRNPDLAAGLLEAAAQLHSDQPQPPIGGRRR